MTTVKQLFFERLATRSVRFPIWREPFVLLEVDTALLLIQPTTSERD